MPSGSGCAFQPPQKTLQLLRQWRLQFQQLTRPGMRKLQPCRMQKISSQAQSLRIRLASRCLRLRRLRGHLVRQLPRAAIKRIPHHRMPDRSHVDPDLMRPPGLDAHPHQRELAEPRLQPPHHLVVRNRRARVLPGSARSSAFAASDRGRSPALMVPFCRSTAPCTSAM